MRTQTKWTIISDDQEALIDTLTGQLLELRKKVGISQGDLAPLIGISRQTYCAIESKKTKMSWSIYLSLILFFDYNQATHQLIRNISAFPGGLVEQFNSSKQFLNNPLLDIGEKQAANIAMMLKSLDEQGLQAMKTKLLMEYVRCTNTMNMHESPIL